MPDPIPDPHKGPDLTLVPPLSEHQRAARAALAAASTGTRDAPAGTQEATAASQSSEDLEVDVTPRAPLNVRIVETLRDILRARPRWSERPPSMAEAWEYSTSGDWTADENSAKRMLHSLVVLIAFAVTYPIDWAIQISRQKPIGFLLCLAVLFVVSRLL